MRKDMQFYAILCFWVQHEEKYFNQKDEMKIL